MTKKKTKHTFKSLENENRLYCIYIEYIVAKNLIPAPVEFVWKNLDWAKKYVDKKKPGLKEEYRESWYKYVANLIQKAYVDQNESEYCLRYSKLYSQVESQINSALEKISNGSNS